MPRIARPVAPGIPHHVTQRGNRREAGEAFVHEMETRFGQLLRPRGIGRPRRAAG